mmetsp:Transcript_23668/g.55204  ORF Transcript_23668/g.55204 Transcript_23668/m.55204 type:complete len:914 (-) Transcript_23668:91-2832(-)
MDVECIPISRDALDWQCSVLRLGSVTILLNCGWTETLDPKLLSPLEPWLSDIDLVLITHADLKHMGALPYLAAKQLPKDCPILCTEAVAQMGELAAVALLEDRGKYQAALELYDEDDVLRLFKWRLTPMKYTQPFNLSKIGKSLVVRAYPAGGQLGSAYWTLQSGSTKVVFLVDYEMRSGRFLDGIDLRPLVPAKRGDATSRWDIWVTSPPLSEGLQLPRFGASKSVAKAKMTYVPRTAMEETLLEDTTAALRRGGTVLVPVDVVGKALEVLLLFEQAWLMDRQLSSNYPLVWLSSVGDMVLDQAKTRLEYMSSEVLNQFEKRLGTNPFVWRNVQIFQSLEELSTVHSMARPKVILTTSQHLEHGDSRELFLRLCTEPRSLVWIFGVPPAGSLARQLLEDFALRQSTQKRYHLRQFFKAAFSDEQLRQYYDARVQELEASRQEKQQEEASKAAEESVKLKSVKAESGSVEPAEALKQAQAAAYQEPRVLQSYQPKIEVPKPALTEPQVEASAAAKSGNIPEGEPRAIPAFWAPTGWPESRTMVHIEPMCEGDDYGHLLTATELRDWRSQDQEGFKYSGPPAPGTEATVIDEADDPLPVKAKVEDGEEVVKKEAESDLQSAVREKFPEPMRCEVKDRVVRVCCQVGYLPDSSLETRDLYAMLRLLTPKNVVMLPTESHVKTQDLIMKYMKHSAVLAGTAAPTVHAFDRHEFSLRFHARGIKRRLQLEDKSWQRVNFTKTSHQVKVAQMAAVPIEIKERGDERIIEMSIPPAAEAEGASKANTRGRLLHHSALFLDNAQASGISLSSVKETLMTEHFSNREWLLFRSSRPEADKPWSAKLLAADNKVVLGWTEAAEEEEPQNESHSIKEEFTKQADSTSNQPAKGSSIPVLRLEGFPGESFFRARAALYSRSTVI